MLEVWPHRLVGLPGIKNQKFYVDPARVMFMHLVEGYPMRTSLQLHGDSEGGTFTILMSIEETAKKLGITLVE